MVDEFSSEQEQVEAIKKWLRSNGPGIIAGIVIGLAAIAGWRFWGDYQRSQAEQSSLLYDTLIAAIDADDLARAKGQAAVLKSDYEDSAYAALAALMLAKNAVSEEDYAGAIEELAWVIEHSPETDLATIARLRLSRVLFASERYAEAQRLLEQIENSQFAAELKELEGDIYLAMNDYAKARNAYQAAQAAAGGSSLLQLKLNNLPPLAP